MKYLTIRNLSPELAERLDEERRAHGRSLNQTVLDLLSQAVGLDHGRRSNGLGALGGAWTREEHAAFEKSIADLGRVDEELWR